MDRQDPMLGLARRSGWGRNSLRRPVDRVEALSVVLMWSASMVIALGGVVFGLTVTQADLTTSVRQMAQLHPTSGVLLDGSVRALGSTVLTIAVPVRYTDQSGATRTGKVDEAVSLAAGTTVPVWLDERGAIVEPPMTPEDAVVNGVTAGASAAGGAEGLLLAAYLVVGWRLNHKKFTAIDLEWAQLSAR